MKINNISPVVFGILLITLIALATSCTSTTKLVNNNAGHYGINPNICPAYN
jgi:succinate-acetate transporter protein